MERLNQEGDERKRKKEIGRTEELSIRARRTELKREREREK